MKTINSFRKIQYSTIIYILFLGATLLISCSKDRDEPDTPKQNIEYKVFNETLKTYTPQVGTERFEFTYWIDYEETSLKFDATLGFAMSWEQIPNGYYVYFNNSIDEILVNDKGQAKGFDGGFTIDAGSSGKWNQNAALAYDYELNPTADKGELAGKGDKYIAVRIWDNYKEGTKYYYGWIKVNISANGRNVKVIDMGIQLDQNKSLKTGER